MPHLISVDIVFFTSVHPVGIPFFYGKCRCRVLNYFGIFFLLSFSLSSVLPFVLPSSHWEKKKNTYAFCMQSPHWMLNAFVHGIKSTISYSKKRSTYKQQQYRRQRETKIPVALLKNYMHFTDWNCHNTERCVNLV